MIGTHGALLLQRRRDTGQWALPGCAQELGETPAECAVRECQEKTGVLAAVTGFLGIYSDPSHIVAHGEIRQEYEVTLIGRPVSGAPAETDEASHVAWFRPAELDSLDMHPAMRRQIAHYLAGKYPHVD